MLIELARRSRKEVVPLRVISRQLGVSKKYMERIARRLENAGIIKGEKGVKGGYQLAKPATNIKVLNALSALEGDFALSECLISKCKRQDDCLANRLWVRLDNNIKDFLEPLTIADLLQEAQ